MSDEVDQSEEISAKLEGFARFKDHTFQSMRHIYQNSIKISQYLTGAKKDAFILCRSWLL